MNIELLNFELMDMPFPDDFDDKVFAITLSVNGRKEYASYIIDTRFPENFEYHVQYALSYFCGKFITPVIKEWEKKGVDFLKERANG